MKEKDAFVDCPEQQVILYVEKDNGEFAPVQTGSYLTKNFLDDYEMKRKNLEETLHREVLEGKKSPVYYYMVLEDLTISELAARAGIRKGKVKKHLEPQYYRQLDAKLLEKYATVFNIESAMMTSMMAPVK